MGLFWTYDIVGSIRRYEVHAENEVVSKVNAIIDTFATGLLPCSEWFDEDDELRCRFVNVLDEKCLDFALALRSLGLTTHQRFLQVVSQPLVR